jgi:site-specific DNA-methyltransferase (adenine-specific)
MKITDKIQITNEDNMALMARCPDNYFDLEQQLFKIKQS